MSITAINLKCPSCGAAQTEKTSNCSYCGNLIIITGSLEDINPIDEIQNLLSLNQFEIAINKLNIAISKQENFELYFTLTKAIFSKNKNISINENELRFALSKAVILGNKEEISALCDYHFCHFSQYHEKVLKNKNSPSSIGSVHVLNKIGNSAVKILSLIALYHEGIRILMFKIWFDCECWNDHETNRVLSVKSNAEILKKQNFSSWSQKRIINKYLKF